MDDAELVSQIAKQCKSALTVSREVTDRRGSRLLELTGGAGRYALKLSTSADSSVAHEAKVLKDLADFTNQLRVASGRFGETDWLLLRWLEGRSAYRYASELREVNVKEGMLELFVAMFRKLADLHALGYLHGDLQPDHFRSSNRGDLWLLDYGLTHKPGSGFPYQGALVHFSAPEVCRAQLDGLKKVPYDASTELYSLASVAFFLYTNQLSADYGSADIRRVPLAKKRECIARGERRSFAEVSAAPWPGLEAVLDRCMAPEPAKRYGSIGKAKEALVALGPAQV